MHNIGLGFRVGHLQSGFRPETGTREDMFNLRTMCKKSTHIHKDVYVAFIDCAKAFDCVKHTKTIECLPEIGIK